MVPHDPENRETVSENCPDADERSADCQFGTDDVPPTALARAAFEASPIATLIVDSSGVVRHANDRAAETIGRPKEQLVGRTYDVAELELDGRGPTAADRPVARVFETGERELGVEQRIEHPDGSERWLVINAAPIPAGGGTVENVLVTLQDVTELKRRQERLTSGHMRHVVFRADESAIPPSLRLDHGERRLEVESVVSLPDGATIQYMGTSDLSAIEFVNAVEEVPHYVDVRLLSTTDGYSRIEARAKSATVSEVFQSLGGRPRAIIVAHEEVLFRGELPGDVDHRLAAEGIARFHPEVELVSEELVYSPHLLYDIVTDALTERQFAALEAAYFSGYFDTPRTSTGGELSDRFGVTRQTFNQHLRKAQQVVFKHLFEKSAADGG